MEETTLKINKNDLVSSRDVLPEDKNFILATMLRGLYYGGTVFSEMNKKTFMVKYHPVATMLLQKHDIKIASLKEDPNVILGYVLISKDKTTLHWAFCRKQWRNIGIIKDLVPNTVTTVTHLTKVGLSIAKNKGLTYDPFMI